MKSNFFLFLIIVLGLVLLLAAGVLWHLSDTTEISRNSAPAPRLITQ
jgi:hypothetical protein